MRFKYTENLNDFNLKGRVKYVIYRCFTPNEFDGNNKNSLSLFDMKLLRFNNKGNLVKYSNHEFMLLTKNSFIQKYEYDKNGYCTKSITTSYKDGKIDSVKYSNIIYDIEKRIVEIQCSGKNKKRILCFNNNGLIIDNKLDENGDNKHRYLFKYTKSNKLLEKVLFNKIVFEKTKYIPNTNGKSTKEYTYIDDKLITKIIYKYDEYENIIMQKTTKYIYKEKKHKIKIPKNAEEFMPDLYENKEYSITGFEYKYDNKGNWIKKVQIDNYLINFITYRKIFYHD